VRADTHHTNSSGDVQIDCNDVQLFADEAESSPIPTASRVRQRRLRLRHEPHLGRPAGVQHRTKTGTFYVASGIANWRTRHGRSLFGTQEPDAYFWGETIEKARPEDLPDHAGRLHDLRAADAALGDWSSTR
jgi:hypothetical protein